MLWIDSYGCRNWTLPDLCDAGIHKRRIMTWPAERLLAFQICLCFVQLITLRLRKEVSWLLSASYPSSCSLALSLYFTSPSSCLAIRQWDAPSVLIHTVFGAYIPAASLDLFRLSQLENSVNRYYSKPTRRNCSQSILLYCRITLHVSGVVHTHHQEYIKL